MIYRSKAGWVALIFHPILPNIKLSGGFVKMSKFAKYTLAIAMIAVFTASIFGTASAEPTNVVPNTKGSLVSGQFKTNGDGNIFTLNTLGALTTLVTNTVSNIDWIVVYSSATLINYIQLADGKTVSAVTAGSQLAPLAISPISSGAGATLTKPSSLKFDFSESPIPFVNGIVILSSDTVNVSATIKYHKAGGK